MRIGLLVEGDTVNAFEAEYIRRIPDTYEVVILNFVSEDSLPVDDRFSTAIWRYWSKNFLHQDMYSTQSVNLSDLVRGYYSLPLRFFRKGKYSFHACEDALSSLPELDVILSCQYRILRGEFLSFPKHGVWSFHHDDETLIRGGPAGFWGLYEGRTYQGAILQRLTSTLDGGFILRKGWFACDLTSLAKTRDKVFFESAQWIQSALNELELNGAIDGYVSETSAPVRRAPSNFQMLKFFILIFLRSIKAKVLDFFFYEVWNIAVTDTHPLRDVSLFKKNVRWLPEPRWPLTQADPFWCGKLIYEEMNYEKGKGALKFRALDKIFEHNRGEVFIQSELHHSYPYSFREVDGAWRVVPESHLRKKTSIYDSSGLAIGNILEGEAIIDPSIYYDGSKYWVFCTKSTMFNDGNSQLYIYFSSSLGGPFYPHPLNPVKSDVRCSRPAGSFFSHRNYLYRPTQDCSRVYGGALTIQRIDKLTETEFLENTVLRIDPISPYKEGIHHLSSFEEKFLIDGKRRRFSLDRVIWRLKQRDRLNHILHEPIANPGPLQGSLRGRGWDMKGVASDGWCAKRFSMIFNLETPMILRLDIEVPGWYRKESQSLKVKIKRQNHAFVFERGYDYLEIKLDKGMQSLRFSAKSKFYLPKPDGRISYLRLMGLSLRTM